LLPTYDLALIKTLSSGQQQTVSVGDIVSYTIVVSNQGTVPSNDYTVIDEIPAGMSFVSASNFGTASGTTVTWASLPNINPGDIQILTIELQVDDASFVSYRNFAEISEDSASDYGVKDEDSTPDDNVLNDGCYSSRYELCLCF